MRLVLERRLLIMSGSGSSESLPKIHWFTKSEIVFVRGFVCWDCGRLIYCSECKKFECFLGFPLSKVSCPSRVEGKVVVVDS